MTLLRRLFTVSFAEHLMHRRCRRCWNDGFYEAAVLADRKDSLVRQGFSDVEAEELLRIRLAAR